MQTQKDEIRRLILLVARNEFFMRGVKQTSMKTIAEKVGVAVGNIYTYYESKDELLRAVLAPFFQAYADFRKQNCDETYASLDIFHYDTYLKIMQKQVASLVHPFKKEWRLLICETTGTSLRSCFDDILNETYGDAIAYLEQIKALYPQIQVEISPCFVRILCNLWGGLIKQLVLNEDLDRTEQDRLISDYVRFDLGGWKHLLGIE